MSSLEKRIVRLEKQNRRFRMIAVFCGLLFGVGLLAGMSQPQQAPNVIRARAFEVVNENGQVVWNAFSDQNGGAMSIKNNTGNDVGVVMSDALGGSLGLLNNDGHVVCYSTATPSGGLTAIFDENGIPAWRAYTAEDRFAGIGFYDAEGTPVYDFMVNAQGEILTTESADEAALIAFQEQWEQAILTMQTGTPSEATEAYWLETVYYPLSGDSAAANVDPELVKTNGDLYTYLLPALKQDLEYVKEAEAVIGPESPVDAELRAMVRRQYEQLEEYIRLSEELYRLTPLTHRSIPLDNPLVLALEDELFESEDISGIMENSEAPEEQKRILEDYFEAALQLSEQLDECVGMQETLTKRYPDASFPLPKEDVSEL